jgi:hypothetical protein
VQPLRRWVPGAAKHPAAAGVLPADGPAGGPADGPLVEASPQDIAFCLALHSHGGVAVAEDGFKAEAELLRMRRAGLLDLQRDQAPPFAVTRVALSPKARELVSRAGRGKAGGGREGVAANEKKQATTAESRQEWTLRRSGFEVARGMLNAAVKSEIAAWKGAGGPGGYSALEIRILTRISEIEVPFPA